MDITNFTDKQLAGQRLMVGFNGTELNKELKFLIDTILVGGIILFSRNIFSPEQTKNLCKSIQKYAFSCGQPPLFIAIDQEGGEVSRLKKPFTQFPGNPAMNNEEDAKHFAEVTGTELNEIGVNMNMAPVMDIAYNDISSIMAGRSFGHNSDQVSKLGIMVIEHLQKKKIMAVAKHYPGIGRTTADSHLDMPVLDTNFSLLNESDLLPFKAAVEHNVSGIMLSHILYSQIDPEWPASLSPIIAKQILRDKINFKGIIITDDIDMGAIKRHYNIKTITRQILASDIDVLLICHAGPDIKKAFDEILSQSKNMIRKKAEDSLKRILKYKKKFIETEGSI